MSLRSQQESTKNSPPPSKSAFLTRLFQSTHIYLSVANTLLAPNGLGIDVTSAEPALRTQLDLEENSGLIVTAAPEESLGAKAGLRLYDVIVQVNEQSVSDAAKFRGLLDASEGQNVKLRVLRQGRRINLEATPKNPAVARLAVNRLWRQHLGVPTDEQHFRLGVTLSGSDETLRRQLRLAEGEGLVVTHVVPDGAAAAAGIQKHDVLIVLDGKRLTTVEAINNQIQEIKEKSVELRLLRGGRKMTLQVTPRKVQESSFAADNIVLWDTQNCRTCHGDAHDTAHSFMGARLSAAHSAWTNGQSSAHYLREIRNWIDKAHRSAEAPAPPQQQIEAITTQLSEMQKAISALEAALNPTESQKE